MNDIQYHFHIPEIPDYTHYKFTTAYEGSVREQIFMRAEHLLRMVANFQPGALTLVFRFYYNPQLGGKPQDRLRCCLGIKTRRNISHDFINQIILAGPLAEFYEFEKQATLPIHWKSFQAATEIIRLEEHITPSSPPGLDIHKLNEFVPEMYYCIHPFKSRDDNDFMMFDKACSYVRDPALLEIMIQPTSQHDQLELQHREIVKLMAVNSYSRNNYIIDVDQLDPFQDLYEPKLPGENELRAKDPMADEFLKIHREVHRILRQPQLAFSIKIWAASQENARILASTAAECGLEEGLYKLIDYDKSHPWFAQSLRSSIEMIPFFESRDHTSQDFLNGNDLKKLIHMASVDEFKGMFRFPVSGYSIPRCLWKSTDYHRKTASGDGLCVGHAIETGNESIPDKMNLGTYNDYWATVSEGNAPVYMPDNLLTKHMFVAGVPGSGKTTAIFNLLVQLFGKGIPFLVIEPGKSEYRQLKMLGNHPDPMIRNLASELRIYTPGKEEVSPFRFNPFQFSEGITTGEHISQLLTCFEASMPLGGPLQALLSESVEAVYENRKRHKKRDQQLTDFPVMNDLVDAARAIMATKGYVGEVRSNLAAAIDVRLSSLTRLIMGNIFNCRQSMPSITELLKHPTVIEVQNLNTFQSCLLVLFLLTSIWEEIKITRQYSRDLKHVTVIEEAHNIVGRSDNAHPSEDFADPKVYAAEFVVRMLAEIRAMGEGIIIADQLPTAVAASVVKTTGTKLAHRLVSLNDREDLGGAMLLEKFQMEEIARLEPGQAYYYTEGLYAPRQIVGLDANQYLDFRNNRLPDNNTLMSVIKEQKWFLTLKNGRYSYVVHTLFDHYASLERLAGRELEGLKDYRDDFLQFKVLSKTENIDKYLLSLHQDIIDTRKRILHGCRSFSDFVKSIPHDITEHLGKKDLCEYRRIVLLYQEQLETKIVAMDDELGKLETAIRTFMKERKDA